MNASGVEPECRTCEDWGTVVIEDDGQPREVACPAHVGAVPIPAHVLSIPAARADRHFDAGDRVRVCDELAESLVMLPADGRAASCDIPADTPDLTVCCVPVALIRSPADDEDGVLRWVELEDLARVNEQETPPGNVDSGLDSSRYYSGPSGFVPGHMRAPGPADSSR
jgi:hypothetical protein